MVLMNTRLCLYPLQKKLMGISKPPFFQVDQNEVKKYFALDAVTDELLRIYQAHTTY